MSLDVELFVNVDTGGDKPHEVTLYEANITHNLNKMAMEAGIYQAIWRPEEIGCINAGDIIEIVETGLKKLKDDPKHYEQFNSPNGWGTYVHFVPFVEKYLNACKEHPLAMIYVSR